MPLIIVNNAAEEIRQAVESSIQKRSLELSLEVKLYLAGLLESFVRSENPLKEFDREPVTFKFHRLAQEKDKARKIEKLQNLGDLCLYLTGFFPDFILKWGNNNIEYHVKIGSSAYWMLGEEFRSGEVLFHELAQRFPELRLVIGDLRPQQFSDNLSLLKAYEQWQKTGDPYYQSVLANKGIIPQKKGKSSNNN